MIIPDIVLDLILIEWTGLGVFIGWVIWGLVIPTYREDREGKLKVDGHI